MKILVDIGHPGHVHYFKNVIEILKSKGHKIIITARNREFIFDLLEKYELSYIDRGKGSNSVFGKFWYMLLADYKIWKISREFNPDLFLSFSSPYAAQVSSLLGKPHIALNDTEHEDAMYSIFTYPFSSVILTPLSFQSNLGKKQIRFNNLVEGLYLHKKYFQPDKRVKKLLGVKDDEEYIIFRFVSWNAHHDFGHSGLDFETKTKLIKLLKTKYRVFISSEDNLPEEFTEYKLKVSPEKIHDVLYYASLYIGESSTMASESAMLGTHAVFINSLPLMCNIKLGQDVGLIKQFDTNEGVLKYVSDLIETSSLKIESKTKSSILQMDFIDATSFLVWFIENYPESKMLLDENPDYQYRFK